MSDLGPSRRRAAYATLIGGYVNIGVAIVQGVLLVPLYLHYIGPQLYGAWLGSGDIVGWLAIVDLGLASLMIQRIGSAYGQHNDRLVAQYLTTGLLAQLIIVATLVAGAVIISRWVPSLMGIDGVDADVLTGGIVLAGVSNGLSILNNGVAGFAMALQRTVFMSVAALIGALVGISITITLLLNGWGLWAIPVGWVARDASALIGNGVYAAVLYRTAIRSSLGMSKYVWQDFIRVLPSMFAAKLGNAMAGRSEAALIAIFIKPELATVYVLTKRAADIIRMLLDRFGAATFAGFAHLIGSGHKTRATEVYKEIMSLYVPTAVLAISLYIALNHTFMSIWVNEDMFGGQALTILIGFSVFVSATGHLLNYLYLSTGRMARGSQILLVEGVVRLILMVLLLSQLGLYGLPLSTIVTATIAGFVTLLLTRHELNASTELRLLSASLIALGLLFVLAMPIGIYVWSETWLGLALIGAILSGFFFAMTLFISTPLRLYAQIALRRMIKLST